MRGGHNRLRITGEHTKVSLLQRIKLEPLRYRVVLPGSAHASNAWPHVSDITSQYVRGVCMCPLPVSVTDACESNGTFLYILVYGGTTSSEH